MLSVTHKKTKKAGKAMLAITLTALAAGTIAIPSPAQAIGLKQNSAVEGNMITLGDIFYDLPRDEDRVLGPAPSPGQEMVLNARTLMRIAIALDLPWRPASSADYIVLNRAATFVDRDLMEHALRKGFKEKGITGKFNVLFSDGTPKIILPQDMAPGAEISQLEYRPDNDWFSATFVAPSKENPIQRINVNGKIERLVEIPVLRESVRKGTIIGKYDIEYKEVPKRLIQDETILKAENLEGMTPRRVILSGEPVRTSEIEAPRMISRGENITMVFNSGALTLTAKGKALQDGAKGDVIQVVNAASKRTIDATVSGSGEVVVAAF